jgi:HPt (histidine-containing phosphotransfer) domain-containing protein
MSSIVALTGNRPEMIQSLIDQLISSCRDDARELAEASVPGKRQDIRDVAHKIKGAARIISARQVIDLCETLEHACESGTADMVIADHARALQDAMTALERELLRHQRT